MKKITLSVAALALVLSSNAQQAFYDTTKSVNITEEAIIAKENHSNLYEIVIRAEDMITMLDKDVYNGHMDKYYAEFYEDLLEDIIKLTVELPKLHKDFESPEFREEIYKTTELERK